MNPTCRHCNRGKVNRPRGLCWTCYHAPGVRDRYPSTSKFARHGHAQTGPRCDPMPTAYRPGTPEKLEALAQRAAAGERLWHPNDAAGV